MVQEKISNVFDCGKLGPIALECQGGRKESDDPKAEKDSRRKRQANESQGKLDR